MFVIEFDRNFYCVIVCVLCCFVGILWLSFVHFKGLYGNRHCKLSKAINAVVCGIDSCFILVPIEINIKESKT